MAADDSAKKAQESRSSKYHIGIKEGGNVTKPSEYEDCPDGEFGDPVNFRYPCNTEARARSALSYWGNEKNRSQYSSEEVSIITRRIHRLAKAQGIEVSEEDKSFDELENMMFRMLDIFKKKYQQQSYKEELKSFKEDLDLMENLLR